MTDERLNILTDQPDGAVATFGRQQTHVRDDLRFDRITVGVDDLGIALQLHGRHLRSICDRWCQDHDHQRQGKSTEERAEPLAPSKAPSGGASGAAKPTPVTVPPVSDPATVNDGSGPEARPRVVAPASRLQTGVRQNIAIIASP